MNIKSKKITASNWFENWLLANIYCSIEVEDWKTKAAIADVKSTTHMHEKMRTFNK